MQKSSSYFKQSSRWSAMAMVAMAIVWLLGLRRQAVLW